MKGAQKPELIRTFERDKLAKWRAVIETLEYDCKCDADGVPVPEDKDKLGEGAFGKVFKARVTLAVPNPDPTIRHRVKTENFPVAVKFFDRGKDFDAQAFMNETMWKALNYPSINRFLYCEMGKLVKRNMFFIVSDYCIGNMEEVINCLKDNRRFPPQDRFEMAGRPFDDTDRCCAALGTACAIGYLHFLGLIHRDIKSSNVLVDMQLRVRLADFGLLIGTAQKSVQMNVCGTPGWMAPDMAGRDFFVTEKVDVYSLGIFLASLFRPGIQILERSTEISRDELKDVGPKLSEIILNCLKKKPTERFDIRQAIEALSVVTVYEESKYKVDRVKFDAYRLELLTPAFTEAMGLYRAGNPVIPDDYVEEP